jgi:hypothetical protein
LGVHFTIKQEVLTDRKSKILTKKASTDAITATKFISDLQTIKGCTGVCKTKKKEKKKGEIHHSCRKKALFGEN